MRSGVARVALAPAVSVALAACTIPALPVPGSALCSQPHTGVEVRIRADHNLSVAEYLRLTKRVAAAAPLCGLVKLDPGHRDQVIVTLPGFTGARATELLAPGRLRFSTWVPYDPGALPTSDPSSPVSHGVVNPAQLPFKAAGTYKCFYGSDSYSCLPPGYAPSDTGLDGRFVRFVDSVTDRSGAPSINVWFNREGGKMLADLTRRLLLRTAPDDELAVFVDTTMVFRGSIRQPLDRGGLEFSAERIKSDKAYRDDLVAILDGGEVPKLDLMAIKHL